MGKLSGLRYRAKRVRNHSTQNDVRLGQCVNDLVLKWLNLSSECFHLVATLLFWFSSPNILLKSTSEKLNTGRL